MRLMNDYRVPSFKIPAIPHGSCEILELRILLEVDGYLICTDLAVQEEVPRRSSTQWLLMTQGFSGVW